MGKKKKEELPDYTVADMDLEGMPWNSRRPWQILPGDVGRRERKAKVFGGVSREKDSAGTNDGMGLSGIQDGQPPISGKERREMIGLALKAALLIGAVFAAAALLFILFCLYVWF